MMFNNTIKLANTFYKVAFQEAPPILTDIVYKTAFRQYINKLYSAMIASKYVVGLGEDKRKKLDKVLSLLSTYLTEVKGYPSSNQIKITKDKLIGWRWLDEFKNDIDIAEEFVPSLLGSLTIEVINSDKRKAYFTEGDNQPTIVYRHIIDSQENFNRFLDRSIEDNKYFIEEKREAFRIVSHHEVIHFMQYLIKAITSKSHLFGLSPRISTRPKKYDIGGFTSEYESFYKELEKRKKETGDKPTKEELDKLESLVEPHALRSIEFTPRLGDIVNYFKEMMLGVPEKQKNIMAKFYYKSIMGIDGKSEFPLVQQLINLVNDAKIKVPDLEKAKDSKDKRVKENLKDYLYKQKVYSNLCNSFLSEIERLGYKIVL